MANIYLKEKFAILLNNIFSYDAIVISELRVEAISGGWTSGVAKRLGTQERLDDN